MENSLKEKETTDVRKLNINNYIKELAVSSLTAVIMLTISLMIIRFLSVTDINTFSKFFMNMLTTIGVLGLIIVVMHSICIMVLLATQKLKQSARFIRRKA